MIVPGTICSSANPISTVHRPSVDISSIKTGTDKSDTFLGHLKTTLKIHPIRLMTNMLSNVVRHPILTHGSDCAINDSWFVANSRRMTVAGNRSRPTRSCPRNFGCAVRSRLRRWPDSAWQCRFGSLGISHRHRRTVSARCSTATAS
jgi:hypothetical protein